MCDTCKCFPCVCGEPEPSDDGWLHHPLPKRLFLTGLLALFLTTSTPLEAQRKPPKPPTRRVCPTCHGTGQIVISGGQSRRCPRCGGKGFIQS